MNSKLQEAVAIFKTLGWEDVNAENVLQLTLGTTAQKQTALAGLKSGEWGEIAKISENSYGWRSYVDVDNGKLALFAVRLGVDTRRAVNIMGGTSNEMMVDVIAARGAKFASDFIGYACVSRRRMFEHSSSVFGNVAVQLVDRLNLEIPQSVEYMKDWAVYAAAAMDLKAEIRYGEVGLPGLNLIKKRFVEHILTGVTVGVPATGPFGTVLPAGVKRGWLSREKAVELTFVALDASVRPGDRKVWLNVLDELDISEKELYVRIQALIPLLASGDTALIMRLAPGLIIQAEDSLLTEVLLASFSASTKKARQLILKSALCRPCPEEVEGLVPWLSVWAGDTDKTIASLSKQLMKQWEMKPDVPPEEKNEIQNLWKEAPPVWQVPPFDLGAVSPEALTELTAKLVNRPAMVHDVVTEQFLAMANAVAYQDADAARTSLRGLRPRQQLMEYIVCWVKGEKTRYGFDKEKNIQPPLTARDYVVCCHLGESPCLLSTPCMVDLSIRVPELVIRLASYKKTGTNAFEADLFLALTRLDISTKTPEAINALHKLDVPVVLQSGKKMTVTAGQIILAYLDNPVKEPPIAVNKYGYWGKAESRFGSEALSDFPDRLSRYENELFSVFPHWGDSALSAVRWDSEVYHEQGLILRQVARRAIPLPPGASMNLLAAQRSMTPDAAEDSMLAVTEAWERGLLRPGVADVALLDWSSKPPSNLAILASALDNIARDGMLAVVWPILDQLVEASLKAPRLLAGTAELVGLIAVFLPEVQFAVAQGITDDTALYLPGIRTLARHGGASRAVCIAQEITALLPSAPVVSEKEELSIPVMNPPFEEVWATPKEASLPIDDRGTITVDWVDPNSPTRLFLFTLTFPHISDRVFQVVNRGWYYDLEKEGQCCAYAVAPGVKTFAGDKQNQVWLHWDQKQQTLVACDQRNWVKGNDGPLHSNRPSPLSSSLLTVMIGLLAQDGDAVYFAPRLLRQFIENGQIGEEIIRKATQTLLQSPVVSPAKLTRALEKDIKLLPVLWPMLTECIKSAGLFVTAGNPPPVWVNRVFDIALRYAPYLTEAIKRGLIPPGDAQWLGLSEIASSKSKSAAVAKANKLLAAFE